MEANISDPRPTLKDLGFDLLNLSGFQLIATLATPFIFFILYFVFAVNDLWIFAVLCTMALSFTTYGSSSHDLVHENLKLNRTLNSFLLSLIELICFRSGHAYKQSHLYHHNRYPNEDDVEGAAARMSLSRTLIEGVIFQPKIYFWAILTRKDRKYFGWTIAEGIANALLISFSLYSLSYTYIFFVYMCLMIGGSWVIPLVTSYVVHTPEGADELHQTRLFRGRFFPLLLLIIYTILSITSTQWCRIKTGPGLRAV